MDRHTEFPHGADGAKLTLTLPTTPFVESLVRDADYTLLWIGGRHCGYIPVTELPERVAGFIPRDSVSLVHAPDPAVGRHTLHHSRHPISNVLHTAGLQ